MVCTCFFSSSFCPQSCNTPSQALHTGSLDTHSSSNTAFHPPETTSSSISHSVMSDCEPMDCSPPGSSVHGILQARILECSHSLLQRIPTQGANLGLPHCRQILYHRTTWEAQRLERQTFPRFPCSLASTNNCVSTKPRWKIHSLSQIWKASEWHEVMIMIRDGRSTGNRDRMLTLSP